MQHFLKPILVLLFATTISVLASCSLFTASEPYTSGATTTRLATNTEILTSIPTSSLEAPTYSEETFAIETTVGSFAETSGTAVSVESRIEVTAPSGWIEDNSPTFIARFTKGDAFFLVAEESFFSSTDLDSIVEEATTTLLAVFENAQLDGDVANVSIDGHDGRRFILTSTINGVPTTSSYSYVVLGDRIFSFVFSQTSDLWPSFIDDEEAFLSGVSIS